MSYTRPVYNAANVTWQGKSSYTRPAYNAANAIFFELGITEITVTSPSTTQRGYVRTSPTLIDVTGSSAITKSIARDVSTTITVSSPSLTEYSSNDGGRLTLIAAANYTPPDGDNIQLFSATGNWVLAREPKPVLDIDAELTGAAVFAGDALPTTDFTTELTGAVIQTGDGLPTTDFDITLYGSVVTAIEKAATLSIATDMNDNFDVDVQFTAPTLDAYFEEKGALGVSTRFPELSFSASISRPLELRTTIEAPVLSARIISRSSSGLDVDFTAPVLDAGLYRSSTSSMDTLFTAPELEAVIMGGQLISVDTAFTAPTLRASALPSGTFEVDVAFPDLEFSGSVLYDWSMAAIVPIPEFECSVTSGLKLDRSFTAPTLIASFSSGISLEAEFDVPSLQAGLVSVGFSVEATVPELSTEITISGGRALVLNTLFPVLNTDIQFTNANTFSMVGVFPNWTTSIKLGTGGFSVDALFPIWQITAGNPTGLSVVSKFPVLTSSISAVINNANSEDFR